MAELRWEDRQSFEHNGWYYHPILESGIENQVNYHTHGLYESHDHLDLQIVLPLNPFQGYLLFVQMIENIKEGAVYSDGEKIVLRNPYDAPFIYLKTFFEDDRKVLRLIFPDVNGNLPNDTGCEEPFKSQMLDYVFAEQKKIKHSIDKVVPLFGLEMLKQEFDSKLRKILMPFQIFSGGTIRTIKKQIEIGEEEDICDALERLGYDMEEPVSIYGNPVTQCCATVYAVNEYDGFGHQYEEHEYKFVVAQQMHRVISFIFVEHEGDLAQYYNSISNVIETSMSIFKFDKEMLPSMASEMMSSLADYEDEDDDIIIEAWNDRVIKLKDNKFTQKKLTELMNSDTISIEATGIMLYLIKNKDDFSISFHDIYQMSSGSAAQLEQLLDELQMMDLIVVLEE